MLKVISSKAMPSPGPLYAVFSDSSGKDRDLFFGLQSEYLKNSVGTPFDTLKNTIQKLTGETAACVFIDGVVYSAAKSGARVMIYRNRSLVTILASPLGDSGAIAASGYPKDGDVILLGTNSFFENNSDEAIKSNIETFTDTSDLVILKFENGEEYVPKIVQTIPTISINQKISNFLGKISKKLPQRNIYIKSGVGDEVSSHGKKMTFSIGVILLVILLASIGFGVRQKKINDLKSKYQGILAIAQSDVDQAVSLASVSPEKSRELFLDSEAKLQEIKDLKVKDPKVTNLENKIEESRGAILGEYDGAPVLFLDLSLLSSGFNGDAIYASNGQIFILDKSGQRIVSVAEDTKKSQVVAGPDTLSGVTGIASYTNTIFVLNSNGIYQLGLSANKVIDKTWTGEAFISAFAGNIYVLDKTGNEIYRYIGQTDNTFSTQQNWLSTSTKPNFSNALSWGMDGAIYVLYPNSKILKFSQGSPQNFSLTGVVPQIGKIDTLYADPDNQYIYLLDRAGKRVVVVDKKGNYKAQYTSDQIASATSLVVSEAQKEILLLTGSKLLSIGIK
jgi:hypothetical protein